MRDIIKVRILVANRELSPPPFDFQNSRADPSSALGTSLFDRCQLSSGNGISWLLQEPRETQSDKWAGAFLTSGRRAWRLVGLHCISGCVHVEGVAFCVKIGLCFQDFQLQGRETGRERCMDTGRLTDCGLLRATSESCYFKNVKDSSDQRNEFS